MDQGREGERRRGGERGETECIICEFRCNRSVLKRTLALEKSGSLGGLQSFLNVVFLKPFFFC